MNNELVEFIVKRTHLKPNEVRADLKLAEDIGCYGIDAISFFEDFFNTFQIKNLEAFDVNLYIDGGPDFAPKPLNWIKNLIYKKRRKYLSPDITIGHLQTVIENGTWVNDV